jgi:molybdopterin-synthase adenylyltransferase
MTQLLTEPRTEAPLAEASPTLSARDLRQRDLVPPQKLAACRGLVIGVGAIGRQVAVQLAALGIPSLDLVDFDTVEVENLAVQGYFPDDLGRSKVAATADLCLRINPQLVVRVHAERFRRSSAKNLSVLQPDGGNLVVFCCVDTMNARAIVHQTVKETADLLIDGRMNAEVIRVLASALPALAQRYPLTLFGDAEAFAGSCTARTTIYTASIAAGLMIGQFTRWLRGLPVEADLLLNLLSAELSVR